jgi:hypothetical protein
VTSIVNNILYAINAFGTIQFFDKIKYICGCLFFFFFLLVKKKKLSGFKKPSRLT